MEKSTDATKGAKKLEILITIVDRERADYYVDLLESYDVNLQHVIFGEGTAPAAFDVTDRSKAVIISFVADDRVKEICSVLSEKFKKVRWKGKGIAFTIPMNSIIGVAIYQFLTNQEA